MRKLCIALVIAALVLFAVIFQRNESAIINWIKTLGVFAPVFFLLIYCIATLLFLPTIILTIAGGVLFGPFFGILFNLMGATLGAACAFFISRYLVFDWLAAKKTPRINNLMAGVEAQGWKFVALLRLIPIIPFSMVNYGLGVTRIKFSHYLVATLVFLIPAEIIFTYCGFAGMDMLIHYRPFDKINNLIPLIVLGVLLFFYAAVKHHRRNTVT